MINVELKQVLWFLNNRRKSLIFFPFYEEDKNIYKKPLIYFDDFIIGGKKIGCKLLFDGIGSCPVDLFLWINMIKIMFITFINK
jgi:hypothetical protein